MKIVNQDILSKIDKFIEKNKENCLNELMDLVRVPSVQGPAEDGARFGKGNRQMLEETAALYEKYGFKTDIEKDGYYALSYCENKGKTIGIFSHGDVVPPDGEWLVCPPFEPIVKDGYMFGRGCNDDKSGVIQALYAAKFIKENIPEFKSRIVMFTGANEETGMKDIQKFASDEVMPDFSISPDGEYPFYGAERSIIRLNVTSNRKFEAIKDFCGGTVPNIVLGEVVAKLQNSTTLAKEIEALATQSEALNCEIKGDSLFVTAIGKAAHSVSVDKGLNAAVLLANELLKCKSLPETDREILKDVALFIGAGHGAGLGIHHIDKDFGEIVCSNGVASVSDGALTISLDIRAGTSFPVDEICQKIISSLGENWTADIFDKRAGYMHDMENDFSKMLVSTFEEVTGITGKKPIFTAGGTYSRILKNSYSIGTINYDIAEPIDLPQGHGGCHQPDEKLNITGFLNAVKILICFLLEADAMLNQTK